MINVTIAEMTMMNTLILLTSNIHSDNVKD